VRDITDRKEAEEQKEAAMEALRKSEKYFKEITENASDILIITDESANVRYCSRSIERFTGYKPEEIIGKNAFNFMHPDELKRAADDYAKAIQANDTMLLHNGFRVLHKNGSEVYLDGLGRNLLNNPDIRGFVMNVRDITDRKQAEDKLRDEQQRFKALAEQSSEMIVLVNREGTVTYDNPAIENALGFKREERLGLSAFSLVHSDDLQLVNDSFKILFNDVNAPVQKAELRLRHKDGSWRTFDVTASNLVHDNVIEYAIVNLHDITERKKALDEIQKSRQRYLELSIHDDLSHLYNSRHFYIELKKEIERANRYDQPLTLLLMDLDKFKDYNDTYGHLEGDNVLSQFGKLIKKCLRENDSAYRYGGEEFTLLLPMTSYEEGIVIAQRIQTELSKENFSPFPNKKVYLTVSIGLSQYQSKEDIKSFVQRVDQLMYKVKKTQRGKICSDNLYMQ
jgi:diguanylate cyclase (GGDEF)-like protein/PAS domain S-box-containing protein